jgi:hypothetical protein
MGVANDTSKHRAHRKNRLNIIETDLGNRDVADDHQYLRPFLGHYTMDAAARRSLATATQMLAVR